MEVDSDSDEETQIQELSQLTAVLEADEPVSENCSQYSARSSLCSYSSKVEQEYSHIQSALALNKLTDEKLRRLEGILFVRLRECRKKLKEIDGSPVLLCDKQEKTFRYINCGKPYFKGRDNFPAPDNEDTKLMAKSNMYDFSNVTCVPGWTVKDKGEFISILHKMSLDKKRDKLHSQIAQLKRNAKGKAINNNNLEKCINAIMKEIDELKKKSLAELALPIDEEYDWDTVANKTNYRHSPQEYRSLWKLFLHPSIKKSSWTKTEHMNLQNIAHANNLQDWEKIAEELDTGRTAYQCFVYFRTNMSNTFTGQKWSKEEEEYLKRLIEYYREDDYIPWSKVASFMENRTKIQIYNKYARLMEQRKGRFLQEEDAVILTCVKEFGPNFRRISNYLPGRSASQLRVRYQVLAGARCTGTSIVWTIEEDKKLIQLMANQDSSTNYSSLTQYFPGKDRAHIRARYTTLVKWMRKHPNAHISRAPRRGARRLGHGQASQDLNKAVENLKNRMQTEVDGKRTKTVNETSDENAIEKAIVTFLINEQIREEEVKKIELSYSEQSLLKEHCDTSSIPSNIKNLKQTLIFLKAKLSKDWFANSTYYINYSGLLHDNSDRCLIVKSYSKKNTVKILNLNSPDIWGENTLATSEYVFPPNYSTVTGCRKLMAYISSKNTHTERQMNIGILVKRNEVLKEQMNLLMERFKTLFLWPMLLSNDSPKLRVNQYMPVSQSHQLNCKVFGGDSGITIPPMDMDIVNDTIDLDDSADNDDIVVKDVYVGNNDFLYMKH